MIRSIILFMVSLCMTIEGFSCTTFILEDGRNLVFARNLDWVSDNGSVLVNKRNIKKKSLVFSPDKASHWTSSYGSITFNQFGKELPFGGINEKGLVVELMLVAGVSPAYDKRTVVNELQWVQYQLDNSASVEEIIASDKFIRLNHINQHLHYLVADSAGNRAVIEFDEKGMQVYKDDKLPISVLENDPYEVSLASYKKDMDSRFFKATEMIEAYTAAKNNIINYSFEILEEVALDGSWSIVYHINHMQIHFKTVSNRSIRIINMNEFDFSCDSSTFVYDLQKNDSGDISKLFIVHTDELNRNKLEDAFYTNNIQFPEAIKNQFFELSSACFCNVK